MRANNKPRNALAALSALAVAIGLTISTMPTAHADDRDDRFLDALKREGIVAIGDTSGVLSWAHWACDNLAQGAKKEHIIVWLSQYNPTADNAVFLREASLYYCPEYKRKAGW
jgi:hypothetical protein